MFYLKHCLTLKGGAFLAPIEGDAPIYETPGTASRIQSGILDRSALSMGLSQHKVVVLLHLSVDPPAKSNIGEASSDGSWTPNATVA